MRPSKRVAAKNRARTGFATATVLGLVAVVALLSAGALHDALFGEQLATSRLLHQRAAALADLGVEDAMARVAALDAPGDQRYALQPDPGTTGSISVALRHIGSTPLPQGYSLGRFDVHHFEIESTGYTARGIRMTQVQGVSRTMPAGAPATAEVAP